MSLQFAKNDTVTIDITGFGNDGEGIGHADGYTLFVAGAVPGDSLRAKILKANKYYGFARIEEILKPSPDREAPVCPVFKKCGGCSLLHINYASELKYKETKVRECVERIGGFAPGSYSFHPIIGMNDGSIRPLNFRNKAQFPVGRNSDGELAAGFFAKRSHRIIPIDSCPVEAPVTAFLLKGLIRFCNDFHILPYDESTGRGLLRHLMTRCGFTTGEVGVCLVINGRKLPNSSEFVEYMKAAVASYKEASNTTLKLTSVTLNVNTDKTNVIMGSRLITLFGNPYITDNIGKYKFNISPLSFFQVNPEETVRLYNKALEFAELKGFETVWDLYCGIGTISLFLSSHAKEVYGVEIVPEAIENAKENARLNDISNVHFSVGAAENVAESLPRPDVIVVDPPRKGCDARLISTMIKYKPKRLVYVSCDPATLARDLRLLCDADSGCFKLTDVQAVDQFSGSPHVETVARLELV